jgi:hypothetical protein
LLFSFVENLRQEDKIKKKQVLAAHEKMKIQENEFSCLSPLPQYSFAIKFICHMNFKLQFSFDLTPFFLTLKKKLFSFLRAEK